MPISWETLTVLASVLCTAFTLFFHFKKIGEDGQKAAVWRALVDEKLKDIADDVKEWTLIAKGNAEDIRELASKTQSHEHRLATLERENKTAFAKIDELRKELREMSKSS